MPLIGSSHFESCLQRVMITHPITDRLIVSELALLSEHTAKVMDTVGTSDFAPTLLNLLRQWVQIDEACLLLYPSQADPTIVHRETDSATQAADVPNLETFITGPFMLDPYFVAAAREARFGFFPLTDLAPEGFKESEYYRTYYRFSGLVDECGFLVPLANDAFANLSLARTSEQNTFTPVCLRRLGELHTLVTALLKHHFLNAPSTATPLRTDVRAHMENRLQSFGRDQLTPRESEIISAILHGHTTKTIALDLTISIETVKLHRKNAYRKLCVRNQSELFYSFLQTL